MIDYAFFFLIRDSTGYGSSDAVLGLLSLSFYFKIWRLWLPSLPSSVTTDLRITSVCSKYTSRVRPRGLELFVQGRTTEPTSLCYCSCKKEFIRPDCLTTGGQSTLNLLRGLQRLVLRDPAQSPSQRLSDKTLGKKKKKIIRS